MYESRDRMPFVQAIFNAEMSATGSEVLNQLSSIRRRIYLILSMSKN